MENRKLEKKIVAMRQQDTSMAVQVTLVVYSALFMHFFLIGSIDPLLPRLTDAHDLSSTQLSIILSSKSFTHMAMSPLLAVVSSRIQAEILFCFGVCGIALSYVGMGLSVSFAGFVSARVVQGMGIACVMVAGMSILIKSVPREKRGKYTSYAYSALGHATLVAPILSGVMYDKLGQLWTFMIPGFLTFLCAIVAAIVLSRTSKVPGLSRSESFAANRLDPKNILPALKVILSNPLSWIAFIGIYSNGMSMGSCESTLPQLLVDWDNGSLDVIVTNLMWSIGPLTFTIFAPIVGWLVDKFGAHKVFITGLGLSGVVYPLFDIISATLVGLGVTISLAFFVETIIEVSVYPLVGTLIDACHVANSHPVGYAMTEMSIQGGFAIGAVVGRALFDWNGLLAMGIFMGSWNLIVFMCANLVFRGNKHHSTEAPVVEPAGSPKEWLEMPVFSPTTELGVSPNEGRDMPVVPPDTEF